MNSGPSAQELHLFGSPGYCIREFAGFTAGKEFHLSPKIGIGYVWI